MNACVLDLRTRLGLKTRLRTNITGSRKDGTGVRLDQLVPVFTAAVTAAPVTSCRLNGTFPRSSRD